MAPNQNTHSSGFDPNRVPESKSTYFDVNFINFSQFITLKSHSKETKV